MLINRRNVIRSAGAVAGAAALGGNGLRAGQSAAGRLHLRRPGGRLRLDDPARHRAQAARGSHGRRGEDHAGRNPSPPPTWSASPRSSRARAIASSSRPRSPSSSRRCASRRRCRRRSSRAPRAPPPRRTSRSTTRASTRAATCRASSPRASRSRKTIGYIAAFPVPEVIHAINTVMRGAWSVDPSMKIRVVWVNAWFNPGREADAARALIDQGCDVICQHTDSPAPLQLANERGVFGFGQASDMTKFAPRAHLTSSINNWGDYYVTRAKAVIDGTWKPGDVWGGLQSGMFRLAPFTNMTPEEASEAQKVRGGDLVRQAASVRRTHRARRRDRGCRRGRTPHGRSDPLDELFLPRHRGRDAGLNVQRVT